MTEAVVKFVLGKLGDLIAKEAQFLGGAGEKVERVQRELTRIKCCLKDAHSKNCKGDESVQNWLNELCDVAYRIEDAIDTFFLEVEDNHQKDPEDATFLPKLKKLCTRPLEVPINLHKLGIELDKIQNQLEEIAESRVRYGIKELQDIVGEAVIMPLRRATYQEVDETEVIGLHADKNNILKLLSCKETPRRIVITIVGTGGLGKTTLAQMVYKRARSYFFEYHTMLSISQQYNLTDLLRKMIHQLKSYVPENQDMGSLMSELRSILSNKRYLIILDDVWTVDLWNQLKHAFPDDNNKSRVLMTSRFVDVAKSADPKMNPYELKFLNDEESRNLLLKKAFPYQEPSEECPSDLLELANKLSKKCKGLPLALIVVGGILSTKEQKYHTWERVLQIMDWHSDGKDCMNVLAMSYDDMPYYLKPCFLYLVSFPEDYEISAKRLIRMWVAEGFIQSKRRTTVEEIAQDCIEELFQRSMIQVSSRCMNGSIKCFQVHDLLREFAMHVADKEKFVTVFSQETNVNRGSRRASIQSARSEEFTQYIGPNTRSFLWFPTKSLPKYTNFRLLKVLEIVKVYLGASRDYGDTQLLVFEKLVHLKYLACNMRINGSFSCSFHHMKNLETLDMRGTKITQVNGLWTVGTLRHVLFDGNSKIILQNKVDGPISTADLKNLQTMCWVTAPRTWARELPILNNLRKLGIIYQFDDWVTMTNLLKTLPSLVSLGIQGISSLPMDIVYLKALPNYNHLQSLFLWGAWSENVTLEASLFPPHLLKLTLVDSQLKENPMPELGKLKSLKKLCLIGDVLNYSGPTICPAGFPDLQYLQLEINYSHEEIHITVAKGVMPKLKDVQRYIEVKLELPPELQHVTVHL